MSKAKARTGVVAPPPYRAGPEEQARDYVPRYHPRYDPSAERPEPVVLAVHRAQVYTPPRSHVSDISAEQLQRARVARAPKEPHQFTRAENRGQRVLRLLRELGGRQPLVDLATAAGLTARVVTEATKSLRRRGIILSRRIGQRCEYYLPGQSGAEG